ncbi:MAG TPA: MG2 domain-containing protein, partial [Prolixibacteraceae bacterium]|nr:MG2 domain-containing protein [Prolixibacteraceae bacterium]
MKKLILTFAISLFLQPLIFAQVIPEVVITDSTTLYEKLYLHIDRELYQPGDDVWFKSYLVSGVNHKPIPGFKNVYVQLISEKGEVVDSCLMLSAYGATNNDFHLPDTLPKGNYTIRCYTKYQQNFGEESMFHQKIAVAKTTDIPEFENHQKNTAIIAVSFLPEGGAFVLNAANNIAFKAIDENGRGIPVTGKIVDETGAEIVSYKSRYKGMGTFLLMPQEGKKYFAQIDGYPDFSYEFENPRFDGIALKYTSKEQEVQFTLSRNIKSNTAQNLILIVSQKGEELFREQIRMTGFQHPINIFKGFFPEGISKVTLLNEQENELAERLIYLQEPDEEAIKINLAKKIYQSRDSVIIEALYEGDSISTGISLAVVSENYFSQGGRSQSMKSYLLLDSELKGPLESPADYFFDSEEITSNEKLDLIMLVNGWRSYYWDDLQNYFGKPLPGWDNSGLTIKGQIKNLFGKNWVENGTVELGPFSRDFLILKDTTDEQGRFSFDRLYLPDSALIMLNAKNSKGRNKVEFINENPEVFDSRIRLAELNKTTGDIHFTNQFYEASYNRHLAEREFELEQGTILLKDVEVTAEKWKTPTIVAAAYGDPDRGYELSDTDRDYYNILKYLHIEVPGVYVFDDKVRLSMAKKSPKIFVDGIKEDLEILRFMSMKDIAKVEIYNPSRLRAFINMKTNNPFKHDPDGGVISILTTRGFGSFDDTFIRPIQGRITPTFTGFKQAREFYSPQYPLVNDSINKPDQRPTLFWEP